MYALLQKKAGNVRTIGAIAKAQSKESRNKAKWGSLEEFLDPRLDARNTSADRFTRQRKARRRELATPAPPKRPVSALARIRTQRLLKIMMGKKVRKVRKRIEVLPPDILGPDSDDDDLLEAPERPATAGGRHRDSFFSTYHLIEHQRPGSPASKFLDMCDRRGLSPRPYILRQRDGGKRLDLAAAGLNNDGYADAICEGFAFGESGGGSRGPAVLVSASSPMSAPVGGRYAGEERGETRERFRDNKTVEGGAKPSPPASPAVRAPDTPTCPTSPPAAEEEQGGSATRPLLMGDSVQTLSLESNSLGDRDPCARLIRELSTKNVLTLTELDLSENRIGSRGGTAVSGFLLHRECRLRTLAIRNNRLSDRTVSDVLDPLRVNSSLTSLDLSKNYGGRLTADVLADVLHRGEKPGVGLRCLNISWNRLSGFDMARAVRSLETNTTLLDLDVSFNSLGKKLAPPPKQRAAGDPGGPGSPGSNNVRKKQSAAVTSGGGGGSGGATTAANDDLASAPLVGGMKSMLENNTALTHLNAEHNEFPAAVCRVLVGSLNKNHSILGLHVSQVLDSKGFVERRQPVTGNSDAQSKAMCWLCSGWRKVTFVWSPELGVHAQGSLDHIEWGETKKEADDDRERPGKNNATQGAASSSPNNHRRGEGGRPNASTAKRGRGRQDRATRRGMGRTGGKLRPGRGGKSGRAKGRQKDEEGDEEASPVAVCLHLSFDRGRADEMHRRVHPRQSHLFQYTLSRMCPPGKVTWYVTVRQTATSKAALEGRVLLPPVFSTSRQGTLEPHGVAGTCNVLYATEDRRRPLPCDGARPRARDWYTAKKAVAAWQLETSCFAARRQECDAWFFPDKGMSAKDRGFYETEALVDAAFVADFDYTKIKKVIKDEDDLESCKKVIRKHFRSCSEAFMWYCAQSADFSPFALGLNAFTLLMQDCQIPEPRPSPCETGHLDTIFIAANVAAQKDPNDPYSNRANLEENNDNSLTRFELMEVFVRVAQIKYVQPGKAETYTQGLTMVMEQNVAPFARRIDPEPFRKEHLYQQTTACILEQHIDALQWVFEEFSAKRHGSKGKVLMEVRELCGVLGGLGAGKGSAMSDPQELSNTDIHHIFVASRMVVADEMKTATTWKCKKD